MRQIAVTVALLAVALASSCRSESEGEAKSPAAEAGEVLAVSGDVSATRGGGEPRPLDVGSPVYADDVITTGDDGSVRIRLDHNRAEWELGGGERRRVDESLAWRAPEAAEDHDEAEEPDDSGERSVAAGRHAENAAADTRATAPVEAEAAAPAEPEPAPPARARRRAHRSGAREERAKSSAPPSPSRAESAGAGAAELDVARGMVPADAAPQDEEPPSGLELQKRVSAAVRRELGRCFDEAKAQSEESLGGRVDVTVRVTGDGRFDEVDLEITRGQLPGVTACAQRGLQRQAVATGGRAVRTEFSVYLR